MKKKPKYVKSALHSHSSVFVCVFLCVCMYMCVYIPACMHTCVYVRIYKHTHIRIGVNLGDEAADKNAEIDPKRWLKKMKRRVHRLKIEKIRLEKKYVCVYFACV